MDGKLQTKTPAEFFAENRNIAGFDNVRLRCNARAPPPRRAAAPRASGHCCMRPGAPRGRARSASGNAARRVSRGAAAAD